jgi:hypothetical protein
VVFRPEYIADLRSRGAACLAALSEGGGDPETTARILRELVDAEMDPVRRAEAILNLAAALERTGPEGLEQAIAITDRALATLGSKYRQSFPANLMAAQRMLKRHDGRPTQLDFRKALDYLHAAIALPMTAGSRDVIVSFFARYTLVAEEVGDYSKLTKARHLFDRLRKHGFRQDEIAVTYGGLISLYRADWQSNNHRPSLAKALALSAEALLRFGEATSPEAEFQLAALRQQRAILLHTRYANRGSEEDLREALSLLQASSSSRDGRPGVT